MAPDRPGISSLQRLPSDISGHARGQLRAIQPIHHVAQLCHQQHLLHLWPSGCGLHVSLSLVLGSTGNHDHWCFDHHGLFLLLHPSAHGEPESWVHLCHLFLPEHLLWHSVCLHTRGMLLPLSMLKHPFPHRTDSINRAGLPFCTSRNREWSGHRSQPNHGHCQCGGWKRRECESQILL